jgi:hypothetical protein
LTMRRSILEGVEGMEKSEILEFVKQMKAKDHVIMFYSKPEDKRLVLFTYLKSGLDQGEAAAYVASQESRDEIREAMKKFGINVDRFEESGALHVIDYKDWYIIGGRFNASNTKELLKRLYDQSIAKGFKGLRLTGEMACFFNHGMVKELVEYEKSLHKVFEIPVTGICAYDNNLVADEGRGELYLDLIKAHSTVIFAGPEAGVVKSR